MRFTAIAGSLVKIITGPVRLRAIDSGRVSGGTIDGWEQDNSYTGGDAYDFGATVGFSQILDPPSASVINTVRYYTSSLSYTLTDFTPSGNYLIRWLFLTANALGERVADWSVNGTLILNDYDIIEQSGVMWDAWATDKIPITANGSGQIIIVASPTGSSSGPMLSGIEIYG